jgi:hypothetical protein
MDKSRTDADDREETDGLFSIDRRNVMKAAGASAGALVGGGTLLGSATAATADGNCVQVDFVTGTNPESDLSTTTYSDNGRLIQTKWGETVDNDIENANETVDRTSKNDTCTVDTSSDLSIDFTSATASVDYTLSNCGGDQDLLLVSYESPCNGAAGSGGQWDPTNADQQTVFDTDTTTTQSDGTLTVDVPPLPEGVPQRSNVELYHPLDDDAGTNCITGDPIKKVSPDGTLDTSADGVSANTNTAFDLKNIDDGTGGNQDDYLRSPESGGHDINGTNATIAFWFNWDTMENGVFQVGGDFQQPPTAGCSVEDADNKTGLKLVGWSENADGSASFSGSCTYGNDSNEDDLGPGNWYFLVVTVGQSGGANGDPGYRLHVFDTNGELSNSPATHSGDNRDSSASAPLFVAMRGQYDKQFDGRVDEIYGFSTALTENEVTALYNNSF